MIEEIVPIIDELNTPATLQYGGLLSDFAIMYDSNSIQVEIYNALLGAIAKELEKCGSNVHEGHRIPAPNLLSMVRAVLALADDAKAKAAARVLRKLQVVWRDKAQNPSTKVALGQSLFDALVTARDRLGEVEKSQTVSLGEQLALLSSTGLKGDDLEEKLTLKACIYLADEAIGLARRRM